jgi:hypothetical protein
MKNISLIEQIIDAKLDVATRKLVKECSPDRYFDDQHQNYQKLCYAIVKNNLDNLFLHGDFDQQEHPNIEEMAKTIHKGAFFKYSEEFENEPDICKQYFRTMAQIAFEYVFPAIRAEIHPILQAAALPRGFKGWASNAIQTVREIFRDGGG